MVEDQLNPADNLPFQNRSTITILFAKKPYMTVDKSEMSTVSVSVEAELIEDSKTLLT